MCSSDLRMYPSQDVASSIGNLIALPLQGQALKNGNSAFVDENWNAYPDQWDALFNKTRKLGIQDVEQCMAKWQGELAEVRGTLTNIEKNVRPKPWKKKCEFCKSDVVGKLHMVLGLSLIHILTAAQIFLSVFLLYAIYSKKPMPLIAKIL